MKFRILNDGGFHSLAHITFPIEVDGDYFDDDYKFAEVDAGQFGLSDNRAPYIFNIEEGEAEEL